MTSVPAPTQVIVTTSKPNPIRPIGSAVTLTCSMQLSLAVDIPVIVIASLRGPLGEANSTSPEALGPTYSSNALIHSFAADHSGLYSCTATIRSTSSFVINSVSTTSEVKRVTVG